jgi:hypothetical protein
MTKGSSWSPSSSISVWPLPGSPSLGEHIDAADKIDSLNSVVQEKQTSLALGKNDIPKSTLDKINFLISKDDT